MNFYFFLKYLHVLGAVVILGTGTGIAFFMLMAHRGVNAGFGSVMLILWLMIAKPQIWG